MITTNKSDYPLEMAVWLVHDEYDYVREENYISATALMKPLRHIVLPSRIPPEKRIPQDVENLVSSAMGTALHAGIEKAWSNGNHGVALKKLGYPTSIIERVLVNPTSEELTQVENPILVYLEQRSIRNVTVDGVTFKVGGKFDMVCDGRVTDTKSTGVFTWITGNKVADFALQLSIYRWLNPEKITEDHGRINYIFTDWNKIESKGRAGYPPKRLMSQDIPLLSLEETEAWIRSKLALILRYENTPENEIPECSEQELWISSTVHKYYANPANAGKVGGRSTKNFPDYAEAMNHLRTEGKGTVITVPGTPKRCGFCSAFPVCSQKDKFNHD